jgi:hypothetical protein
MRRDVYHSIVPADTACTLPRMQTAYKGICGRIRGMCQNLEYGIS